MGRRQGARRVTDNGASIMACGKRYSGHLRNIGKLIELHKKVCEKCLKSKDVTEIACIMAERKYGKSGNTPRMFEYRYPEALFTIDNNSEV